MKPSKSQIAYFIVAGLTAAFLLADLYYIFAVAPVEARMGIVQKIFYFHVPSAYAMYIGFITCSVCSAVYLYKRSPGWDAWAVAGAEVGLLFFAIVIITGPLWARKAWGVWWDWDPRLVTTGLIGLVFAAYVALRSFGSAGAAERRFAAGLAVVGALDIPVIHYAVRRWGGTHPTVITDQGGGLHPDMKTALMISFGAFTLLVILLLWARARLERLRHGVAELELEAAQRGLLEDG